jgi:hypothetical protein
MSLQIVMSAAVENGMRQASIEFARGVINQLHSEGALTCDIETAFRMFDFDSVSIASKRSAAMKKVRAGQKSSEKVSSVAIRSKPEMVLPFCGEVETSWCQGVRFNHGLHTQCTNGPQSDCKYCKTCHKSASNSASGKPQYGDISDRLTGPLLEYRDPKGKLTTCYANVAKKLGLDIARAQEVATAYGWTIPEDQLTVKVKKTGRPASTKPKKKVGKKGRPAKVKTSEEMTMDDQIAKLVAEAADDVLSVTSESSVKKVVRVKKAKKVKKVKKVKKTDEQKAQEAEAKKAEAEAKKLLKAKEAEEKKLLKAKEAEEKKLLKAKEAEEKKLLKAKEAEAKKLLKAKEAQEKKLLKAKEAEAKKQAKKAEAEAKKQAKKAQEAEAKKLLKAKEVEEENKADMKPELTMEAVEQLQATIAEEDDEAEDEEDIVLDESTPTVEIDGTEYYVTKAYGLSAVLFDQEGECIGAYDEITGEIQELTFDE